MLQLHPLPLLWLWGLRKESGPHGWYGPDPAHCEGGPGAPSSGVHAGVASTLMLAAVSHPPSMLACCHTFSLDVPPSTSEFLQC